MSGSRYLLDTNAIIALLQGNKRLVGLMESASWLGISIISKLEFLAFRQLSQADATLFAEFESRVTVIAVSADSQRLIDHVLKIRKSSGLKLPDAIIAATALLENAHLITADAQFSSVPSLHVETF